jgi:hypothetical protein
MGLSVCDHTHMKIADTCILEKGVGLGTIASSIMSRNSPEYYSTVKATSKLARALKNNITPICMDLVSNQLITPEQQRKLRNPNHDAVERAADLVEHLTDKVEENPANYHTFVKILEEHRATYKDVLECLVFPSDPIIPTPDLKPGTAAADSGRLILSSHV